MQEPKEYNYPIAVKQEETFTFPWRFYRDQMDADEASAIAIQKVNDLGLIWPVDSESQPGVIIPVIEEGYTFFKVCCP